MGDVLKRRHHTGHNRGHYHNKTQLLSTSLSCQHVVSAKHEIEVDVSELMYRNGECTV